MVIQGAEIAREDRPQSRLTATRQHCELTTSCIQFIMPEALGKSGVTIRQCRVPQSGKVVNGIDERDRAPPVDRVVSGVVQVGLVPAQLGSQPGRIPDKAVIVRAGKNGHAQLIYGPQRLALLPRPGDRDQPPTRVNRIRCRCLQKRETVPGNPGIMISPDIEHYSRHDYQLNDMRLIAGYTLLTLMPSRRVATMLQYHYLKDSNQHWKINDLRDNAALAMTIPYCDIVVTDSAAWNTAVNHAHLDKEFGTTVFRNLTDLAVHLN